MATVSVFSPEALDATVKKYIPPDSLPAGHKNAIVAGVDTDGAHVAVLMALDDKGSWQLKAAGQYGWADKTATVGAEVIKTW